MNITARTILSGLLLTVTAFVNTVSAQRKTGIPVQKVIDLAQKQYQAYIDEHPDSILHLYSVKADGSLQAVAYTDWTSGFFPGALWYLYQFTGKAAWKQNAARWTRSLAPAQWRTNTHDLGFIIYNSFGKAFANTADSAYESVCYQAARSLSRRFNPEVGSIKSWDHGPWHYPVIVDNLMNLELLFWAGNRFNDESLLQICKSHLKNDINMRFRDDGSSFHVLDFDPANGQLLARKTWQGYSDSSCWSRGQSWAIYGFTVAYRYTRDSAYLKQAEIAANYYIDQIKKIPDHIAYWDFNDPAIPKVPRDVSSAAIAASALLELSHYTKTYQEQYKTVVDKILTSLCSPEYLAKAGSNHYMLLKHGVVSKPSDKGVDVPLIYADYYFLEALWRLQHYDQMAF